MEWRFGEGTELKGPLVSTSGLETEAEKIQEPVSFDLYYIATDKCTECIGFHDTPQCAEVCPVDCCVADEDNVESDLSLEAKKAFLHAE
ncbi:MAG: Ferredoxin [Owenweeksia sp. TMED14]|nr:MAG: Ferredoxin [Owenweeksia sp. TMED14]